jgi:hypothetical protein
VMADPRTCRGNNPTPLAVVAFTLGKNHQMKIEHREHLVKRILLQKVF